MWYIVLKSIRLGVGRLILDIVPYRDVVAGRDCFQDFSVCVFKWWERDFQLFFSESYHLNYNKDIEGNKYSDKVIVRRHNSFDLLEAVHGIKIAREQVNHSRECLEIIKKEIQQGSPLAIYLNNYWTPWGNGYQQENALHYCLAIGYDENSEELVCIDPVFSTKVERLPIDHFINGNNGQYFTFRIVDSPAIPVSPDIPRRIFEKVIEGNSIQALQDFYQDFGANFDFEAESSGVEDVWKTPILMKLNDITFGRHGLQEALRFLSKYHPQYEVLIRMVESVFQNWHVLKSLLTKAYLIGNFDDGLRLRVSKRIEVIIEHECLFMEQLRRLMSDEFVNEDIALSSSELSSSASEEAIPFNTVCIVEHYNNIGFSGSGARADFTGLNQYYVGNNPFGQGNLSSGEGFDNIACAGQYIRITAGNYRAMKIVAASEWGDAFAELTLNYEDCKRVVAFNVSEWGGKPQFDEQIVWQGQSNDHNAVCIFEQTITLDDQLELQGLGLPDYPNLHIFRIAIAL